MRYFYDTEFIEDSKTVDLISIGIVAEDGRELYLENSQAEWLKADDWVKANVLPHLQSYRQTEEGFTQSGCDAVSKETMRQAVAAFIGCSKPEFWGYYSAYDHVALCQLFGKMIDLPEGWPYYTRDLRQWLDEKGLSHIKQPDDAPHNALEDARWVAQTFKKYADNALSE